MRYLDTYEAYKPNKLRKIIRNRYEKAMKPLSLEDTIDFVIENCKEYIDRPILISRYISQKIYDCFVSNPVTRVSRDNSNHYTTIMSNTWKEFPKRNKSFICTLNGDTMITNTYYYVIPVDGSKWGIAPSIDIFYCFKKSLGYPDDFFRHFNNMSIKLGFDGINDMNYKELKKDMIDVFTEIKRKWFKGVKLDETAYKKSNEFQKWCHNRNINYMDNFAKWISSPGGIYKLKPNEIYNEFIKWIGPEKNDFIVSKYTELDQQWDKCEVWSDSKSVFVNVDIAEKFFEKLSEKVGKRFEIK